jgi:phage baseplate assembly protein W
MAISFKNVGKLAVSTTPTPTTTATPIGIKTPVQLGSNSEGLFAMNFTISDQIQDNLRNLILTNWGERLCSYNFGANLRELTTELTSKENFDSEAMVRIKDAVSRWMSYISLSDFTSTIDRSQNSVIGKILITITYDVPIANITNKMLEVILYVI